MFDGGRLKTKGDDIHCCCGIAGSIFNKSEQSSVSVVRAMFCQNLSRRRSWLKDPWVMVDECSEANVAELLRGDCRDEASPAECDEGYIGVMKMLPPAASCFW